MPSSLLGFLDMISCAVLSIGALGGYPPLQLAFGDRAVRCREGVLRECEGSGWRESRIWVLRPSLLAFDESSVRRREEVSRKCERVV